MLLYFNYIHKFDILLVNNNESQFNKPYNLLPMKKHHYIIISITLAIYGFVFYQKYYAGPDIVDYFRDKGDLLSIFINGPDKYIGKNYKLYSEYQSKGIPDSLDNSVLIYFNKDRSELKLSCESVTEDYAEIIGEINIGIKDDEEYFYYQTIQSIYSYAKFDSKNKGMKVKCYPL